MRIFSFCEFHREERNLTRKSFNDFETFFDASHCEEAQDEESETSVEAVVRVDVIIEK